MTQQTNTYMKHHSPAAAAALKNLVENKRLLVSVGSGGVGKTTTAAALAIAAARTGRRAAVLTIDPARRLAQALGIGRMGNTPQALPAELVAPGSCDAMMLEAPEAFDDLIARLVPDPERRQRLLDNPLYQTISHHLGGTHEYMAVEKLFALLQSGKYDVVILDTPPTVNALDFLDAPTRISTFFSDKVMRFFVKHDDNDKNDKRGFFTKLRDRAGDMALSVLGKALGEPFMNDMRDFATAFQGLFAAFRERGTVVEEVFSDARTAFVVVTGADPVRVAEADEFTRTLQKFKIDPVLFLVNRVHLAAADALISLTDDDIAAPLAAANLPVAAGEAGRGQIAGYRALLMQAQAVRLALASRDRAGLQHMISLAKKKPVIVVPELDQEVQDRNAIEHVLDAFGMSR